MKNHPPSSKTREGRFENYLSLLSRELDHADRIEPFRNYLAGLLLQGERKSIEPIAARIDPTRVCAKHQSLHHFIAVAAWNDRAILRAICQYALPVLLHMGKVESWVIDDTGFPKRGQHSVGVERQYCGQLGKTENCQVAVSLTVSHQLASLPVAFDLYLPKRWAYDWARRKKAGVPREIKFRTKREIALAQIDAAIVAGLPHGIVNADVAFGNDTDFREELTARKLRYAVGIQSTTTVWPPGKGPLPPKASNQGKRPKLLRRDAEHQPVTARQLADQLGRDCFRPVTWREGARGQLRSHFCVRRVRPAHLDYRRETPRAEEWLLIEWPLAERDPTKYWFLTLSRQASLRKLVDTAKGRWPIEADYKNLKAVGLGDYEVRGWRGFHHHATMSIAAYAFLIGERGLFSLRRNRRTAGCALPRISRGERSCRSADTSGATQPNIDCDYANRIGRCNGEAHPPMSVLPKIQRSHVIISKETREFCDTVVLDGIPLWWLFAATAVLVLLSYEVGFRAGRWRSRRSEREPEVVVRSMVGSMLGLLTFILAFTFWIAATHFDAARQAKLNEANAIRTAYLRADLIPEPHRAEIRNLLREYVDVRLEAIRSGNLEQAISRSEELHSRLWSQAVAAREKTSSPIFAGYFIQSLNEVIALHTRRVTVGLEFRIPGAIWYVLYAITTLAAASVGCHAGLAGASRPLVVTAFVLIISVVMLLIADLDHPRRGALRVSQQVSVDLRRTMNEP